MLTLHILERERERERDTLNTENMLGYLLTYEFARIEK